jgi:uncharacterized membrane protein
MSGQLERWQRNLLPFLIRFVTVLAAFFFFASFVQLYYLHREITTAPSFGLSAQARDIPLTGSETPNQRLAIFRFRTASELEVQLVARRYRHASVLLLGRVWALYLGFVTGMILSLMGAVFVLAKLRETETEVSAQAAGARYAIKSASPGIIMAVLGVVLMMTTILTNHRIDVLDAATYLQFDGRSPRSRSDDQSPPPSLVDPLPGEPKK